MASIHLANKTGNKTKEGYLAKVVKGGFDYCDIGDTPIGIVAKKELRGRNTLIKNTGTVKAYLSKEVAEGEGVRQAVAGEGVPLGTLVPIGEATSFTYIGRALESGKGLVEIFLDISQSGTAASSSTTTFVTSITGTGGGGGTVTDVSGGYGITSTGGTTPVLAFDGTELDIDSDPWPAFGGSSYFVFTSGAVSERIRTIEVPISTFVNDSNYTANLGTVTQVTATSPLASSGGTAPNLTFDASSIATKGGAVLEDDFLVTIDGVSGAMEKKAIEFIPANEFNYPAAWDSSGTVTSVIGGYGITSDADPATPTIAFDGTELDIDDGTAWNPPTTDPYIIFTAGSVTERRLIDAIDLGDFVNNLGWTTNTGTVTSVTATSPLASSGGTTPNITFNASSIGIKGSALLGVDYLIVMDVVDGILEKKTLSTIALSEFNDNITFWGAVTGGINYASGNVGVGTTSPDEMLHVHKIDRPYIKWSSDTTGEGAGDGTVLGFANAAGEFQIRNKEAQDVVFFTNDTEEMRIESGGNVGIGTASISARLQVDGGTGTMLGLDRISGQATIKAIGDTIMIIDSNSGYTSLNHYVTDDVSLVSGGGNVRVGSGAASYKLDVNGTFRALHEIYYGGTGAGELGETLNNVVLQHEGNYDCGPSTGNVLYHRIWSRRDAAGTTWTTVRLHDGISIDSSFGTPGTNTRTWWERDPNSERHYWGSSGTTFMDLDSSGLDVTGAITATGEITAFA